MAETALIPLFEDIADAIREKDGTNGNIVAENFPTRIRAIQTTSSLTKQPAKVWTPTTSDQIIPAETYITGQQTIEGDSNLVASNIKEGVQIFGVTGSFESGSIDNPTQVTLVLNGNAGNEVIAYSGESGSVYGRTSKTTTNITAYKGFLYILLSGITGSSSSTSSDKTKAYSLSRSAVGSTGNGSILSTYITGSGGSVTLSINLT